MKQLLAYLRHPDATTAIPASWVAPLLIVALVLFLVLVRLGLSLIRTNRRSVRISWFALGPYGYWLLAPPILIGLYALDSQALIEKSVAPVDAMTIRAAIRHGEWKFLYPNDKQVSSRLVVPRNRPIRLLLSSSDEIRELCIRQYGIRTQVLAGRYTTVWFTPTESGEQPIDCSSSFSAHRGKVSLGQSARLSVLESTEFDAWVNDPSTSGARP